MTCSRCQHIETMCKCEGTVTIVVPSKHVCVLIEAIRRLHDEISGELSYPERLPEWEIEEDTAILAAIEVLYDLLKGTQDDPQAV